MDGLEMAQTYDDFRRIYLRERRPMVGDPMTADTSTRPPFTAAAGQGQPDTTPTLPHQQPHSRPPSSQPPPPGNPGPITPNTTPATPYPERVR
jgi:hypothetical protein